MSRQSVVMLLMGGKLSVRRNRAVLSRIGAIAVSAMSRLSSVMLFVSCLIYLHKDVSLHVYEIQYGRAMVHTKLALTAVLQISPPLP